MSEELRIVIVEDSPRDVELEIRELRRVGLGVAYRVVQTEGAFREVLRGFQPDLILSDFSMPDFDGMSALALARELVPDVPFIFVSGTIGEENAIRVLKNGATDYILKDNLIRLPAAVERALQDSADRAAHRRAQEALHEAEARFRSFMQHMPGRAAIRDLGGRYTFVNDFWLRAFGLQAAAVLGRSYQEIFPVGRAPGLERAHLEAIEAGKPVTRVFQSGAGDDFQWWLSTHFPIPDADGNTALIGTVSIDITEQKVQEERIARLTRVYAVLSSINGAILRIRDRQELFQEACRIAIESGQFRMAWIGVVNKEAMLVKPVAWAGEVRGFFDAAPLALMDAAPSGHGLVGQAFRTMKPVVSNDVRNDPQRLMKEECAERGINSLAVIPLIAGSEAVGVLALYAADAGFFDEQELRLLVDLAGDISFALDHISKEEKIEYLAYYDSLTGLANRTLFHERLEQAIAAAARGQRKLALVLKDIERFKTINDTLGRQAGDTLLRQVAGRMVSAATDPDWLGRVGPNLFGVMVPDVTTEEELARRNEQRLHQIYGSPFRLGDVDLRVSARLGIAMYPADGADADTLFRNAEAAVKKAKSSGERALFYTEAMSERVAEKLRLENKLRVALENNEFVLHYQPKVRLEDRAICGAEALIRWQSPELGLVPPGEFIPLLEQTGLLVDVGAWALKRAATDRRFWLKLGIAAPRVAVNVSAVQMRQRDFVSVVHEALGHDATPAGIDLEITESLLMDNLHENIGKLEKIRAFGVDIAIDDFGTGYSSLAYLAKLPVQSLKIDRSFISTMQDNPDAMTLVSTIISLAHSLRLRVIAEGVETEQQARILRLLKCDEMQGYLISKAIPAEELEKFCARRE